MIRNERAKNSVCIEAEIYDLDNRWYQREEMGVIVEERAMTIEEIQTFGPQPLKPEGVMATLNAVLGLWPLQDAANAVGLKPQDLITEAESWAVAGDV